MSKPKIKYLKKLKRKFRDKSADLKVTGKVFY